MSAMTDEQKEYASKFMTELWSGLIKPYFNPVRDDDYWSGLVEACNKMGRDYSNNDKRLWGLVMGFADALDKYAREKYGNTASDK